MEYSPNEMPKGATKSSTPYLQALCSRVGTDGLLALPLACHGG